LQRHGLPPAPERKRTTELAMAVSAVIFHDFLSESAAARANKQRRAALATGGKTVAALRFQNSARDTRRAAE